MPGTALWVDAFVCLPGFTCLPLSPFICLPLSPSLDDPVWVHLSPFVICLPLSPSLDAWHGSLGGRVHLSPFVSLHLSPSLDAWRSFVSLCLPSFVSRCLPAWIPGWTDSLVSLCLPSFVARCLPAWIWHGSLGGRVHVSPFVPFICLPFSPSLDAWHGSLGGRVHLSPFVSLDFSRCLPAWMPGTALCVEGFICLPLSPFICLPLSPSLDAWHCFFGGQIHFSPFVSLHLAPVVSQPGCLSRHSRRTDSLVSLGSPSFVSHLCGWTDSFVSLCLPLFVSRCLPAWMCGTHAPRFPSLPAVLSFWRVWFAFGFGPGFGHSLSCGCWGQGPLSALHLDFDFAWARGGSSSLSIVGYTLSVRSVPRYQLRSRADDSGALRCAASATRRLC